MNINIQSPLFLTDLYFYDIRSCYYEIAKSAYYDLGGIDKDDKVERNIALGKEQIGNENFQKYSQLYGYFEEIGLSSDLIEVSVSA